MIWNLCIRRPALTVVIFLVLAIFGVYGFTQMPIQENPDVEFPVVSVLVVLPGAAPEILEQEVVEPLEAELSTIEGLKELVSTAEQESATVTAEFELWRDQDLAAQDVRDAVERARRHLPDDAEAPVVRKMDMDAGPIMWFTLQGDERWDDMSMSRYAEDVLKPRMETLRGVGRVIVGGSRDYAVRVKIDPELLAAHRLTIQDVVDTVQMENVDIPSGRIEGKTREFTIRTRARFSEAEPFNDLVIDHRDGSPVRLSDVGEAVDGVESYRRLARFNGEPTVGLGLVRQTGANTVEMAEAARESMRRSAENFPPGLEYQEAMDASEYIEENIRDLQTTIFIAATMVVFVVLFFLRSGRGTIIVALAIPTSLLTGLAAINVLGFSINVLTMLALILVIGIVVDDAIVILERNFRHMEHGADPLPAARVGTTEMAFPAIANSLSLGAVFIPVAFTGGIIGRFFYEFGLTVAVTVFASTFVALTLTPMLCSRLLKYKERKSWFFKMSERHLNHVEAIYAWVLARAFKRRALVVVIALLAFGAGIMAYMNIPKEFAPDEDRSRMMIVFETPQGATLPETDSFAARIEKMLAEDPNVSHTFLGIGLSRGGGPGHPNEGVAFVTLVPRDERDKHQTEIMQQYRQRLAQIPDGRAFAVDITPGGVGGDPVEVVLQNPDLQELDIVQEQVVDWMESRSEYYVGVRSDLELDRPQVDVSIDREKAAEMWVSATAISQSLRYLFGEVDISHVDREARRYDVITEIKDRGETTPDALRHVYLRNQRDELVSLDNLVHIQETIGPSEIHRFDRVRSASVTASTPPGVALGDAVDELETYLEAELPAGTDYRMAGMSEVFEESFYYLALALIFAIIFIYLVLSAQFESFIYPLSIMTALPLATVGAFGILWLLNLNFSVYAFIGLIMLMGLVTKNAILLVDYTNVLVARGRPPVQAAQEAARERFRPVVMTAISTILGITPIALGYGAGGEARVPLGVAVAAGLFTSTALTLIVIPVVYTLYDQLQNYILRLFGKQPKGAKG
ncbi:acriflavin resistance protein [Desulfonatronospira thiodismutans ASO3-1]|uniref:Acriflavin resistance protein n=1 Tax=Desulfonatronospira thiodismutans ASO3-1 TaxID=555779 RepID=D6SSG1_9BACT|nr:MULTISPECIES: efflux RND transporter permease subunit [Desulfonatronospira]EFI33627.1 acriflavin resistance protein [Desulfonatronospira thiodismutans ASO3-1]RQD74414.1 MAG: efflux RND transporter permease subunit [Desulfonatronospira sp. MSAO_Bac3]